MYCTGGFTIWTGKLLDEIWLERRKAHVKKKNHELVITKHHQYWKRKFPEENTVIKKWSKTVLLTSYDYYPNKMFNKNVALGNNMKYV